MKQNYMRKPSSHRGDDKVYWKYDKLDCVVKRNFEFSAGITLK